MRVFILITNVMLAFHLAISIEPAEINEAFGSELFAGESLWEQDVGETAARLQWRQESETPRDSLYRLYPSGNETVFDVPAYSLALYGEGGKVSSLSLVFINKGDAPGIEDATSAAQSSGRAASEGQKKLKEFAQQIKDEAKIIEDKLTQLFGAAKTSTYGQGRATREQVKRWNWKNHTFLLAAPVGEYVALRVLPTDIVDGKRKVMRDADLSAELSKRVERRNNGDVVIFSIPMVNQGQKKASAAATWERLLRYMGISADMYILAMPELGNGKSWMLRLMEIAQNVKEILQYHGLRLQENNGKLIMNTIAGNIEKGIPMVWTIFLDSTLEKKSDARNNKRREMQDINTWILDEIAIPRREAKNIAPSALNGLVCLIVGYNKVSNEIAVSYPWGANFAERWITLEEAEALSQKSLMTIQF